MTIVSEFWVGTYTGDRGAGRGIYRMRKRDDGTLDVVGLAAEVASPSYLAVHPRRDVLYAVSESSGGSVVSYDIVDGRALRAAGSRPAPAGPCHLTVGPDELLVAGYVAGAVSAQPLDRDGKFAGAAASVVQGYGSGPRTERQEAPHAHSVTCAPDGTVLSTDLGADVVRAYRSDTGTGTLRLVAEIAMPAGSGPRHMVVHPSGPVYVLTELAHTVVVLSPGSSYAELTVVGESPATVGAVDPESLCAAIKLGADGRHVYTSTRGADVITTHEVQPGGTALRPMADTGCGGRWPRDFCVDGAWMHVANQHSGGVATFRLDGETGVPAPTGAPTAVPAPTCILPVNASQHPDDAE